MKKIVFVLIGLTITHFFSQAQNIHYGFTGGLVFANYDLMEDDVSDKGKPTTSVTAGVVIEVPISKNFIFQPAINFVRKGTKHEATFVGRTEKTLLVVNYFEVPMNILFNGSDNSDNFFIGAGPSLSFAISGKLKFDDGTNPGSEDIKFGTADDMMNRLDLGANFLIGGYISKGLLLSVNYNLGLSNLIDNYNDNSTLKSSYFGIRVGYLLNKKAKKL